MALNSYSQFSYCGLSQYRHTEHSKHLLISCRTCKAHIPPHHRAHFAHTSQYHTMPSRHHTIPHNAHTTQYDTTQYDTTQYDTTPHHTIPHDAHTTQYCTTQYCTTPHHTTHLFIPVFRLGSVWVCHLLVENPV